jgi:hypothetical protein
MVASFAKDSPVADKRRFPRRTLELSTA